MARAAREKIVKSFSIENMAAQYHELYLSKGLEGLEGLEEKSRIKGIQQTQ